MLKPFSGLIIRVCCQLCYSQSYKCIDIIYILALLRENLCFMVRLSVI